MTSTGPSSFRSLPHTRLGRWAVSLAATFVILFIVNLAVFMPLFQYDTQEVAWRQVLLPIYGIVTMLSGLAAGVVGVIAIVRQRERSWLIWLILLPSAFAFFFVIGEFLFPH